MGQHRLYVVKDEQTGKLLRVGMTEVTVLVKKSYSGARLMFHGSYYFPPLELLPGEVEELVDGNFVNVN